MHAEQRAPFELAIELLCSLRVELGEHRLERHPHAGQHRDLVVAQVVERVLERLDRLQIRRVALDQQIVQRIVDVGRELERVVVGRPELRHAASGTHL